MPVPLRARYVKLVVVRWSGQCAPELPFPFRCDAPVLRAELLVDPPDKAVAPVAVEPMERVVELQHLREVLIQQAIQQAGSMRELPERPCLSAPLGVGSRAGDTSRGSSGRHTGPVRLRSQ